MKPSTIVRLLLQKIFSFFPLQDKIVFENFRGRGMGDDPKYIALALLKRQKNIKLIWLCNQVHEEYPKGITPVKYRGIRSIYELSTAKVWVYNTKDGFKIPKRLGQFYIQTWHASMGLKKVEKDAGLSISYQKYLAKDAAMTDLMYSNNNEYLRLYKNSFWYNGPVIRSSLPRMSLLLDPQKSFSSYKRVREFYKLPTNCRIILYAPTFRDGEDLSVYKFNYEALINAANERYGAGHVLLIRLHPKLAIQKDFFSYKENVIQASDYPDMQELLAATNILISDYSSSIFDFGATEKPVILYAPDLETYLTKDRGMYFSPAELPFPLTHNEKELCEAIIHFNEFCYKQRKEAFYKFIGYSDDGKGDEHIADIIISRI